MSSNIFERNVVGSRGGRLVKWKGTVASIAPGVVIAAVGAAGLSMPAVAQTISSAVTTTQSVAADGVLTITPTGSVTVTAEAADVAAIAVAADFTGTIGNAGAISATLTDGITSQTAAAIRFAGGTLTGSLTSTGPITASAAGDIAALPDVGVQAAGILGDVPTMDGAGLAVNGPLTVTAQGGMTGGGDGVTRLAVAEAGGVLINGDLQNGTAITATGAITVTATGGSAVVEDSSTARAWAQGRGVVVDAVTGASTISTSGGISVRVEGGVASGLDLSNARAYAGEATGVQIRGGIDAESSLTNTGAITVTALGGQAYIGLADTAGDNNVEAGSRGTRGIFVENTGAGFGVRGGSTINNSGAITLEARGGIAEGGNNAQALAEVFGTFGVDVVSIVNSSTVINTGAITVTALGGTAEVGARTVMVGGYTTASGNIRDTAGIFIREDVEAGSSLRNEAAITVRAQAGSATGGDLARVSTFVRNSRGIEIADLLEEGSTVTNLGDISVTALGGTATTGNGSSGPFDAEADTNVYATTGITLNDSVSEGSRLHNAGDITLMAQGGTATSGDDADARANITNTYGIEIERDISETSSLINTGDIMISALGGTAVTGDGTGLYARAATADTEDTFGIFVNGSIGTGSLLNNSGAVTVLARGGRATAGDVANARAEVDDTYGIHVDASITGGSSVINSGAITVSALAGAATVGSGGAATDTPNARASVRDVGGIYVDGSVIEASVLNNSGAITVLAQGGVATGGARATANAEVDDIYGILVDGRVDDGSSVVNSGVITVTALGGTATVGNGRAETYSEASALAYVRDMAGIYVDHDIEVGSTLNNSAAITLRAEGGTAVAGDTGRADAGVDDTAGIEIEEESVIASTLINSGAITITASGGSATVGSSTTDTWSADTDVRDTYGILVGSGLDDGARLENSGAITVLARAGTSIAGANNSAFARANRTHGISIENTISDGSTLINTGAITVTAIGGTATLLGVETAPGDPPVRGPRTYASSFAIDTVGIFVGDEIGNGSRLENRAAIVVQAMGGTSTAAGSASVSAAAEAIGIESGSISESGALENHGDLSVSAIGGSIDNAGGSSGADAFGIYVEGTLSGTLTNTGDVEIRANIGEGGETSATARAILIDSAVAETGVIRHTGTILAEADGSSAGSADGIRVRGAMNGTVFTDSTIMARAPGGDAYAIHLGQGTGLLDLRAPAFFEGALLVDRHDVNLTSGATHAVHWSFVDTDTTAGVFTLIERDNVPWFGRGEGGDSPQYATYTASTRGAMVREVAGLAQLGTGAMRTNLSTLLSGSGAGVTRGAAGEASLSWGGGLEYRRFDIEGAGGTIDHSVSVAGVSAGHARMTDTGLALGFMLGINESSADVDAFGTNPSDANASRGVFAGLGVATETRGLQVEGGLRFGTSNNETRRLVNDNFSFAGVAVAEAAFDSSWVTISGRIAHDIPVSAGWTLTPSFAASFTRGSVDGYTETGPVAAATVAGYDFGVGQYEVGVEASRALGAGTLSGSLSYVATATSRDAMTVEILGSTNQIGLGAIDMQAARVGLQYNAQFGNGMTLELGGDVLVEDAGVIGGGLSLAIRSRF